jgi:hypothetical protein
VKTDEDGRTEIKIAYMGDFPPGHAKEVCDLVNKYIQVTYQHFGKRKVESTVVRDAIIGHSSVLLSMMKDVPWLDKESVRQNFLYFEEIMTASIEKLWTEMYGDDLWKKV